MRKAIDKIRIAASRMAGKPWSKPIYISVNTAEACNLNCRICSIWPLREKNMIETGKVKEIIDELRQWSPRTGLYFGGLESLTNKKAIMEALEYGGKDLHIGLDTNGTLIDEKTAEELMKKGISHVAISLDGTRPETHNHIRNSSTAFEKAVNGIKLLVKHKSKKAKVEICFVINNTNIDEIVPMYRFAQELGVDGITYIPYLPDNSYQASGDGLANNEFWVKKENLQKLKLAISELTRLKRARKGSHKPLILNSEHHLRKIPAYFSNKKTFRKGSCYAGHTFFCITNQGNVSTCGKGPNLSVKGKTLKEIWASPEFEKTRKEVKRCSAHCLTTCFEPEPGFRQKEH